MKNMYELANSNTAIMKSIGALGRFGAELVANMAKKK